jgi:starch phosphorylase
MTTRVDTPLPDDDPQGPGPRSTLAAAEALLARVERESGHLPAAAPPDAWMRAVAHACRADLALRLNRTQREDRNQHARRVYYLSMEFLMGRALANALAALGLDRAFEAAAARAGMSSQDVLEHEPDAALGNGGLGRLAACFLDSLATLGVPSFGYGLRYRYGIFAQRIRDGRQVEEPDDWLRTANPWDFERPEVRYLVGFGGRVVNEGGSPRWHPAETLHADAFDFVVPGHATERVSVLRQWQAAPAQPIDFAAFSRGDYAAAGAAKQRAESLTWVLYPDDSTPAGRELRLKQEYFLVSATLQDIVARHRAEYGGLENFGDKVAIHLNDTHPALAVPELLRLLHDEHNMPIDAALSQCQRAFSYTNHTLLPEALETWPVRLLEHLLPRHLQLVYEINGRFLAYVRAHFPGDEDLARRTSLIEENDERHVKMAALSIVASHRVNGVSKLHSDLMVKTIFADYAHIFPDRFCNVTNGVTPRRWLAQANPPLAALLDARLGRDWRTDLDRMAELDAFAADPAWLADLAAAKRRNKVRLANLIRRELGVAVDPDSLFDVQIKRIHEYKRQLLNLLHAAARYQAIVDEPNAAWIPRTVVFAGKAASAYAAAKTIVRLIHDVGRTVNTDPRVRERLKIVFLPNYSVSLSEVTIPAADLSEQISTAGFEASGTGNMKFALNGALTIGTWDGANIEIADAVGHDNLFPFGLKADEVRALRAHGYDPRAHYEADPRLKQVLDGIGEGAFSPAEPDAYRGLVDELLGADRYLLLADFDSYVAAQGRADRLYANPRDWTHKAGRNITGVSRFSSDRTIREYARHIWNVPL